MEATKKDLGLMKRKALALTFILALLLFPIVIVPSLRVASATFETFPLEPSVYIETYVGDLQENDRVEGNFTVSNLLLYKPIFSFPGITNADIHTYWVNVQFFDPDFHEILNYTKVTGDITYFFNFTAFTPGRYVIWSYCSLEYFPLNAIKPQMAINYTVLEAIPTRINVLSPLNQTYYESKLSLNFTTNKPLSWVGYSLDGKDNVTIDGNTTLTGLPNGLHKITVYANNTYGNLVSQETILFTVEPFPVIFVAVSAIVVVVAVIGVGLLFYFKKRKH